MYILRSTAALFFLSISFAGKTIGQALPDSIVTKINTFFTTWNNANSPGCAVGIVRNDSLIFSKGYGMANLEYGIPNSDETIFHIASVSKQFTAYGIILLARQSKLGLDDDIHKYLHWFPDMKQKITIRNLLNHTSGIRDQWQLLAIQGTRLDDVIAQDHILKILSKQNALNFPPGEESIYSNSNYTLLAEIIKSVSGQSLRKFADSAIFKTLGMVHTHFHDDYTEIVKNRSFSYSRIDSTHFANSVLSYSNVGATNLFTNIQDMQKWVSNFYSHKAGDQRDIDVLTTRTRLKNGKELNYAAGIISDTHKGWKQFSHSGGDAGFRTFISVLPDLKMGFIVFSNIGDFNPTEKAFQLADLFVKDTSQSIAAVAKTNDKKDSATANLKRDSIVLKNYLGNYISNEGIVLGTEINDHKLYYRFNNQLFLMIKDSANVYSMFYAPDIKFKLLPISKDTTIIITTPDQQYTLKKYTNNGLSDERALKQYTGVYYSPELDCRYNIILKDHHLALTNNKYSDAVLTLAGPDHLLNDFWWMNHLMITRNKQGRITGFEVNSDRVMHLKFTKVEL